MADRTYFYIHPDQIAGDRFYLDSDESHHALHVLRLPVGSEIWLLDGIGTGYQARITNEDGARVAGEILAPYVRLGENTTKLTLALGSIRRERLEWAVEKAVELGVFDIAILFLNRSVHRKINLSRLEAKVMAAAKQCGRSWFPPVKIWSDLSRWLPDISGKKLVCHSGPALRNLLTSKTSSSPITILVGPEGDFTPEELENIHAAGFQSVSLGPRRLRSETAAVTALAIANAMIHNG